MIQHHGKSVRSGATQVLLLEVHNNLSQSVRWDQVNPTDQETQARLEQNTRREIHSFAQQQKLIK